MNHPATFTDRQDPLIELCKTGNAKAQQTLYNRYHRAMFRIALRITHDQMEAEDVLQESFVRAFRSLKTFKGDATFGAWLKRIVINTSINHIKKRKAEFVELEADRFEVAEPEAPAPKPSWSMDQLRNAISQLPDGYRTVFNLYQIEGYDHKEIGHILNISEATSKSQFSRAKRKLRQMLTRTEMSTGVAMYA